MIPGGQRCIQGFFTEIRRFDNPYQCDASERESMLIKDLRKCEEIIAGDNSILRELLNPLKENLKIRYSS